MEDMERIGHIFLAPQLLFAFFSLIECFFSLFSNFPVILQMEHQKDYISKPIFSISALVQSSYSFSPHLSINPICLASHSNCQSHSLDLLVNTTISDTRFSFNYDDSTYESLLTSSVKKGEPCPDNTKQCGILDTLGNIMCIDVNSECPINLILMTEDNIIPSEYKYTFTTVRLKSSYIHYTNEATDNYIVVKFLGKDEITNNLSPFIENENEKLSKYSVASCTINRLKISTKPIFHAISLNQSLYDYYYRPFIGVKSNCLPSEFFNSEEALNDYNHYRTMKLLWLIFNLIYDISLVIVVFLMINEGVMASEYCLQNFTIEALIIWVLLVPCFIFNLLTVLAGQKMKFNYECFDEYTNERNKKIMSDTNEDFAARISSLVVNVIFLIGIIIVVIFGRREGFRQIEEKKKYYQEKFKESKEIEVQDVN